MKPNVLSKMGQRTGVPPISWLMHAALSRPKLISLAAGFTDNSTLPVEISRKLLNEILRSPKTGQPALQYGVTAGADNLRQLTAKHLQKLDGGHDRAHSPERVLITGGSQQLLYMTLEALCDEDDIILVEDPTYFVFLSILQSRGIKARGVVERDGLDLVHLRKSFGASEKIRRTPPRARRALPRHLFSKSDRRDDFAREKIRRAEAAEKIRARRRTSDLSARRHRVSRTVVSGRVTCQRGNPH